MKKKRWVRIIIKLFIGTALLFLSFFLYMYSFIIADILKDNCHAGIFQKAALIYLGRTGYYKDGFEIVGKLSFMEPGCSEKEHFYAIEHIYKNWDDRREEFLNQIIRNINMKGTKDYNKFLLLQLLEKLTGEDFGFPMTYLKKESKISNIDEEQLERGVKKANEWWERRKTIIIDEKG